MLSIKQTREADSLALLHRQDQDMLLMLAERHARATSAMEPWANVAKTCIDFTEGKQWTAEQLQTLEDEGRPALTFNKIAPLVRLILGYHRNNRVDVRYLPGHDGTGTEEVAKALTQVGKHISEMNQEPYVDGEVMLDGIITGRGYYDTRLDFEKNDFGDIKITAKDPFSIKVDPDAEDYDVNTGSFIIEDRWVSLEEVEVNYGKAALQLVAPLVSRNYSGMPMNSFVEVLSEVMPWRSFGGGNQWDLNPYLPIESYLANAYDTARKNVKLVDCQHYQWVMQRYILDVETGDREPIPDFYKPDQVKKILAWAQRQYAKRGKLSPLRVVTRPGRRVRWTTLVGDIIVYDKWSAYETFTITGYFPYFRRGKTRGAVEDLLDPQREINKRRSATLDIVTRSAHSGWKHHESSLTPENKDRLEREGAAPGINIEWKGESWMEPKKIEPSAPPIAMERLETKANDDLKEISGINESLLGQIDKVQSGRAIEARQRQGVISIQIYMDNMSRTKELMARKKMEMVQNHYTEQRIIRIRGEGGTLNQIIINQDTAGKIVNDVTVGRYSVQIDETPLSASFLSAQFEELMMLIEKGVLPLEAVMDIAVDVSSIPQKDLIKRRVQLVMAAKGIPIGDDAGTVPGAVPGAAPGLPAPTQPPGGPPGQAVSITTDANGTPVPVGGGGPAKAA